MKPDKRKWAENEKWKRVHRVAKFRSSRAQFETTEEFNQEIADQLDQEDEQTMELMDRFVSENFSEWCFGEW